uniref:Uncharacterized protein n=1 Tax=Lactuca sativa TaxID=4236 RepID=A0A9R1X823_LACSA|nr:hypothetical protein LSAT_V11C600338900 [Lactuca sativa]
MKTSQANDQAIIKHYQEIYIQKLEIEAAFINSLPQTDINLIIGIKEAANSSHEELQKLLQEIRRTPSGSLSTSKCSKSLDFQIIISPDVCINYNSSLIQEGII